MIGQEFLRTLTPPNCKWRGSKMVSDSVAMMDNGGSRYTKRYSDDNVTMVTEITLPWLLR